MCKVKWIQVSDLHFGDDSPYSKKSRDALIDYVKRNGHDIDYIFVTGDIIYAKNVKTNKNRKEAYFEAERFLKKIYSLIWTNDLQYEKLYQKIFIVPGNHDVIRDKARVSCIDGLRKSYAQDSLGNIDDSYLTNTKHAMKSFNEFYNNITNKKIVKEIKNNVHYIVETEMINVFHINTCIASCSDEDDGKLVLGFKLLNEAIEKVNNDKPTIAIAHHNFDCLDKIEQRKLELLLKEKNILLYLCGHSHERESNFVLRYNQMKMLNTFTCGTLLSVDGNNKIVDTVFFKGELDTSTKEGIIKSYKWTLDDGWQDDVEFGHVQNNKNNFRKFMYKTALNGNFFPINLGDDGVLAKLVSNQSSERNITFYELNDRVESSLSIYGVGITNVSRNTELFDKILDSGGTLKLCMVNPKVFKVENCSLNKNTDTTKEWCDIEKLKFCIYSKHIDQYVSKEYYDEIQRSYIRIKDYLKQAKCKNGKFEVKLLNSFIPMSINIINENTEKAELIIEYNMPFTSKRLLLGLNAKKHKDYYIQVKSVFDDIWDMAEELC